MSQHCARTIRPIEGREALQRNFATLPEKAIKYSNRAVTLNERFSIIERGYLLVSNMKSNELEFRRNVTLISVKSVAGGRQENQIQSKISNGLGISEKK